MDIDVDVELDNEKFSHVSKLCLNCCEKYLTEQNSPIIKHLTFLYERSIIPDGKAVTVGILDAIFDIFGISIKDLTTCFLKESSSKNSKNDIIPNKSIFFCSSCALAFKNLYDAFKDFKRLSRANSLFWRTLKWQKDRIYVKSELVEEDWTNSTCFSDFDFGFDYLKDAKDIIKKEVVDNTIEGEGSEEELDSFSCDNNTGTGNEAESHNPIDVLKAEQINQQKTNFQDLLLIKDGNAIKDESQMQKPQRRTKRRRIKPWKIRDLGEIAGNGKAIKEETQPPPKPKCRSNSAIAIPWRVSHLDSYSGVAPLKCCASPFQTDADFKFHAHTFHERESEKLERECEFCGKRILEKYFDFHTKVLHDPNLPYIDCSTCEKRFLTEKSYKKHRRAEHPRVRWRYENGNVFCEECKEFFSPGNYRNYHRVSGHSIQEILYQCELCGASLKSQAGLNRHMNHIHSNKFTVCCEECGKIVKQKFVWRHKQMHKDLAEVDKELFRCKECGLLLKHSFSLKKHMLNMHGNRAERTISCEVCGKTTKTMTNMRIHMKVHDPNRNIKQKPPKAANSQTIVHESKINEALNVVGLELSRNETAIPASEIAACQFTVNELLNL